MKAIKFVMFGSLAFILFKLALAVRASIIGTYDARMVEGIVGFGLIFIVSLAIYILAKVFKLIVGAGKKPIEAPKL